METHAEIIKRLGMRKLATELGHTSHTTVQGWNDRNKIPVEHWQDVIGAAARLNEALSVQDLMPPELRDAAA